MGEGGHRLTLKSPNDLWSAMSPPYHLIFRSLSCQARPHQEINECHNLANNKTITNTTQLEQVTSNGGRGHLDWNWDKMSSRKV